MTPEDWTPSRLEDAPTSVVSDAGKIESHTQFFFGAYLAARGQNAPALKKYQAALDLDPSNTRVALAMVESRAESKGFGPATLALDELLAKDPDLVDALVQKAKILQARAEADPSGKRENLTAAYDALLRAKKKQPKNLDVLKTLSQVAIDLNDANRIIQAQRDLIAANPKEAQPRIILGQVLARVGRPQEAVALYEGIIEQKPGFVPTYLLLAQLYEDRRQLPKALETYERGLVVDPRSDRLKPRYEQTLLRFFGETNRQAIIDRYAAFAGRFPFSGGIQKLLAERLLQERDVPRAIAQLRKVVELDPEGVDAMVVLGQLLSQRREFKDARKYLEKAVDVNPERVDAYMAIGDSWENEAMAPKAVEIYRKALRLNPNSERLLLALADALSQIGDAAGAAKELREADPAIRAKPEFQAALGQALERIGETTAAFAAYQSAYSGLTVNGGGPALLPVLGRLVGLGARLGMPDQAETTITKLADSGVVTKDDLYLAVGEAYQLEGEFERAATSYGKARIANPDSPKPLDRLVHVWNIAGKPDKAMAALDAGGAAAAGDSGKTLRAETLMASKDYAGAIAILKALALSRPSDLDPLRTLADAYTSAKRPEEAMAVAKQAEQQFGATDEVKVMRGLVLYRAKKLAPAEAVFRELLAAAGKPPETPGIRAAETLTGTAVGIDDYHYYLGSILLESRRFDEAEKSFRAALAANPGNDRAMNALGYSLADRGQRLDEARALVSRALELNPGAGHIIDSLGWVSFRQGRSREAIDLVRRARRTLGDDPEILYHLAEIHMALGEVETARDFYRKALAADPDLPGLAAKAKAAGAGGESGGSGASAPAAAESRPTGKRRSGGATVSPSRR